MVEDDLLAIRAVAALRHDDRHDGIAGIEPVRNAFADFIDGPGHLHSRYVGRRIDLLLLGAGTVAYGHVGGVHRRGMDADPHLTGTGVKFGQIEDLKNVRGAMREKSNRPHRFILPCNRIHPRLDEPAGSSGSCRRKNSPDRA
ncbi:MAG TPA: hypothetical protein VNS02_12690 [Rhizobiaceae bacterium]|nr:hypothetical protein [Rhizobiaceae bacterium]